MQDSEAASWEGMARNGTFWLADPDVQCRACLSFNMHMQVLHQKVMQGDRSMHRIGGWCRG